MVEDNPFDDHQAHAEMDKAVTKNRRGAYPEGDPGADVPPPKARVEL